MLTVIIFGIGYNIANQNFNFQLQQQTQDRIYNLTQDLHQIDRKNDAQQDASLNTIVNVTKQVDNGIQKNEEYIKNITQTNLNNTFKNKHNIQDLVTAVKAFNLTHVKEAQQQEVINLQQIKIKLDKLLNQTRPR